MSKIISNEQPPGTLTEDLQEWLIRLVTRINISLSKTENYDVLYILPEKYEVGTVKYFGAAIPTTAITVEGLWCYKSTGWTQIV